jgi:flagellar protein FlgJ
MTGPKTPAAALPVPIGAGALDPRGLANLRRDAKSAEGTMRIAREFESLLTAMMLRSMRAALPGGDPLANHAGDIARDLFDQNLSRAVGGRGMGVAAMVARDLARRGAAGEAGEAEPPGAGSFAARGATTRGALAAGAGAATSGAGSALPGRALAGSALAGSPSAGSAAFALGKSGAATMALAGAGAGVAAGVGPALAALQLRVASRAWSGEGLEAASARRSFPASLGALPRARPAAVEAGAPSGALRPARGHATSAPASVDTAFEPVPVRSDDASSAGAAADGARSVTGAASSDGTRAASGLAGEVSAKVSEFVGRFGRIAESVARATGLPARAMLGQAALETGWGRREIRGADGSNSFNVFGIKAGGDWQGRTVEVLTTEHVNGEPRRQVERFRAYDGYGEAFADYARLITGNPRYRGALGQAHDAEAFVRALGRAGYATDPRYGDKLAAVVRRVRGAAP